MNKKILTVLCVLALLVSLFAIGASALANVASVGESNFTSIADAVEAANGTEYVKLLDDVAEITVAEGETLKLDLNGNTVTSLVNNGTVIAKDSVTLDLDAAAAGKITTISGNGTVDAAAAEAGVAYVMNTENGTTFHAVDMKIGNVGVYYEKPGVEYICNFTADSTAAGMIAEYGVAVSVTADPKVENNQFPSHSAVTKLTGFVAGAAGNSGRSTSVTGILKDSYSIPVNSSNSTKKIYGKSYVKLTDGTYVEGQAVCYSLQDIMGLANNYWEGLGSTNQGKLLKIYENFTDVLGEWNNIPAMKTAYAEKLEAEKQAFLAKEEKVLKILTLGHSLAVDCGHMLSTVIAEEGIPEAYDYEEVVVGTLYYSGCPLTSHIKFMTEDMPEYRLYISSSKNSGKAPTTEDKVTMAYAIDYDYWDIIVMQGGVHEMAYEKNFTAGYIQKIQRFVNVRKQNPDAIFGWHMFWANPEDQTLATMYETQTGNPASKNSYKNIWNTFENRTALYEATASLTDEYITSDDTFKFVIPTGTAMENALSSKLEETDLHRDYVHATDRARLMNSYLWYCTIFNIQELEDLKMDSIPASLTRDANDTDPMVLSEDWKNIILESVNNAIAHPFEITQSVYVDAPAA